MPPTALNILWDYVKNDVLADAKLSIKEEATLCNDLQSIITNQNITVESAQEFVTNRRRRSACK